MGKTDTTFRIQQSEGYFLLNDAVSTFSKINILRISFFVIEECPEKNYAYPENISIDCH